ncbi:MAG TPA: hypothetical protein EYQ31_06980, partial [Candidatus Handelsmanbacteria bacterium]|nr:hypothetical protein [Candidatus Handelsmanbacteria bacterium]
MSPAADVDLTPIERKALESSVFGARYAPDERITALVVGNFPALGKLAALRFLEWVQQNPEGVISLPTGKTPEHFIKWVQRFLAGWDTQEIRSELEAGAEVVVLGDGKLGLLCALAQHVSGAKVTLVGKHGDKLAKAAAAGIRTVQLSAFK